MLEVKKNGYSHNETEFSTFDENSFVFFPLSFNGEQFSVVDVLEEKNNCLLRGGPGTGKTQTLINLMADSVSKNKNVLFTAKTPSALYAFEELLPDYLKKYVLVLPEETAIDDVKLRVKPYLKNILDLLDKTNLDPSVFNKEYLSLQERFNANNQKLVAVNCQIRDLLNLNQQILVLDGETHTYQMAYDYINNRKNHNTLTFPFTERDYNALIKINWVEFVSHINVLNKNELKYLEMDSNLLNHEFMKYPDELMGNYSDLLQKQKKIKTTLDNTLRDLNKKEFYVDVVNKFTGMKDVMKKYNILLDESVKQNFIKFFSRRKSLHLIEDSMNYLSENMEKVVANMGFEVSFPSNLHETEYLKDLELLAQGDRLDGVMSKLTKKKQKDYFDEVKVFGKPVLTSDVWLRVYEKVCLDINVRNAVAKWNEHANTFGLPQISNNEPIDIAFNNLKKSVDVFYMIANAYIQVEQLILNYMDLSGSVIDNINIIETYINTLGERDILLSRLQVAKANLNSFIQSNFLIPKNLAQAQELLKNDDFDGLSNLFNKEVKEEDSYRPVKEAYVYIFNLLKEMEKLGGENTIKFLDLILESGYQMKVDPRDLMSYVKKTLLSQFIKNLGNATILNNLMDEKKLYTKELKEITQGMVANRVQYSCVVKASDPEINAALDTIRSLLLRLEAGRDSKDVYLNILTILKSIICKLPAVALTNYKSFDYIPGTEQDFELLLIDDASQEGFEYLPLVFKGRKVVVAGDDRMYAPKNNYPIENFDGYKIKYLMNVPMFLYEMITPSSSLLDVVTSVFYQNKIKLIENMRSDADIFSFVNDNFYESSMIPLRAANLTVDSSLVDVFIKKAVNENGVNEQEAEFILSEILSLIGDCETSGKIKTIGVIALSSKNQAEFIYERLRSLLSYELLNKYKIAVGVPEDTQGRERDIVFISVGCTRSCVNCVYSDSDLKIAMTRAKDTVYLVHSVKSADLPAINKGFKALFEFFQPKIDLGVLDGVELVAQGKSEVEKNVMAYLIGREYSVKPGADFGKFSVDLMVYDERSSLAIDIEGDMKEQAYCWKDSVKRQLELEEVGWNFYRVLYSQYCSNKTFLLNSIVKKLDDLNLKTQNDKNLSNKKRIRMIEV